MKNWIYKTLKLDTIGFKGGIVQTEVLEKGLNQLGEQGWELVVAFDTAQEDGRSREVLAIFKKERSESE